MRSTLACFVACILLFTGAGVGRAADDLSTLLSKLPSATNTLSVIRLKAMLGSPRAQRENWAQKYESGYLEGAVSIPPIVDTIVTGAEIGSGDDDDSRRVAVLTLVNPVKFDPATVAIRQKGRTEYVGGQLVVFSPHYGYMAQLANGMVSLFPPGDRQKLARWLKTANDDRPVGLQAYLQDAVKSAAGAHMLLVIDAAEMGDPEVAKKWAAQSKSLAGKPSAAAASEIVGKLIGVRFAATVADDVQAKVSVDFSVPVGEHAEVLHALFLEWLGETGAGLEEFAKAKSKADGNSLVLETAISNSSLRRILTMLQVPTAAAAHHPAGESTLKDPDLTATRRYYQAIEQMVGDLTSLGKKQEDYEKSAMWHDNYADKIDQLPTTYVAPEVLAYGAEVSGCLRALAKSLEGTPGKLDLLESEKYSRGLYYPRFSNKTGAYGPVPGMTWQVENFTDIRTRQNTLVRDGQTQRDEIWRYVRSSREKAVGQMKLKFNVDLTQPSAEK